jgi:importin subunit beta-1
LLLPHAQSILELIQRCLADDERTDTLVKLAFGLVGDLADSFPNGQLKQLLLQEWIANELRNRRGLSVESKKTMRWAKEVSHPFTF